VTLSLKRCAARRTLRPQAGRAATGNPSIHSPKERVMVKNVGGIDRIIRILVGLGLLSLVFIGPQTPWGWLGIVPLATALFGFCPINSIFKINTAKN
jgi:hypothetical protein